MDFEINGVGVGTHGSELALTRPETIHAKVRAAALLDPLADPTMKSRPYDQKPYWSIERARAGNSREVQIELVVNGTAVARKPIVADGTIREVAFDVSIDTSSWVAVRILAAAHTNPMFVTVGGKPIRASQASANWALTAVHQCWSQKAARISSTEQAAARAAYDHAEIVSQRLASECANR
jgi:hypothetical protein